LYSSKLPPIVCRKGSIDGRTSARYSLFLTDREGNILGAPMDGVPEKSAYNLFRALRVPRDEVREMQRHLPSESAFLMQGARSPLLIIRRSFSATRLLIAVVPVGEDACFLARPFDCRELFEGALVFSGTSLYKSTLSRPEEREACGRWFYDALNLFHFSGGYGKSWFDVATAELDLAAHLGAACGCLLGYELRGVDNEPNYRTDYPFFLSMLTSLFLTVRRIAAEQSLYLTIELNGSGIPVVDAFFEADVPDDPLPEFAFAAHTAKARGMQFFCGADTDDKHILHISFSFAPTELSLQELRAPVPLSRHYVFGLNRLKEEAAKLELPEFVKSVMKELNTDQ